MAEIPSILVAPEEDEDEGIENVSRPASAEGEPRPALAPSGGEAGDIPSILVPPLTESTAGEQVGAAARTALGAATRFSGVAAGGKIGAAAGALGGPAAPVTVPLGVAIGMVGGYFAGDMAADELARLGLAVTDPYSLPPDQRAAGVFGEALGAGISGIGQVQTLARMAGRLPETAVGRVLNGILDMARDRPTRFLIAESAALAQSATAEGIYETQRPGHPLERMGVGMAVGVLNPARLTISLGSKGYDTAKRLVERFSKAGRQTQAGRLLQEFMERAEGDPRVFMRALADGRRIAEAIPGFRGTAGQTSGDLRLVQLEAELARIDEETFVGFGKRASDSLEAITNEIALLRGTGDPEALKAVAELRQARYTMAFERLLLQAQRQAVGAAEEVGEGATVAQRGDLSVKVTEIYQRALGRARDVETALWKDAIPNGEAPAIWRKVQRTYAGLRGELAAADSLPQFIEDQIAVVSAAKVLLDSVKRGAKEMPDGSNITAAMIREAERRTSVGELFRFRSGLLARARGMARSTSELADREARQLGLVAEAVLDDMVRAGAATKATVQAGVRRGAGGRLGAEETAFDVAREYTRQLNDTFTRTFAGASQQQGAYGLRMPPETMLKRAFATGDEVASLQLKELAEAADFLPARELGNPMLLAEANVDAALMMDSQARLMRIMASRTIEQVADKDTGEQVVRVSLSRAKTFLREAGDLLERFPEVRESLEAAVQSEEALQVWSRRIQGLSRHLASDSPISRVLKMDSPADAVRGALANLKPLERLTEMATLARGAEGGDAGLRAAIFEHIMRVAETPDKRLSLQRMVNALLDPIRPGLPSMREFMESSGLMPPGVAARLDELVDAAGRVMLAVETRAVGEAVLDATHPIEALLLRGSGSIAARFLLGQVSPEGAAAGGPTLIVAYQGARAATALVSRLPSEAVKKILIDAVSGEPLSASGQKWSLLEALMGTDGTEAEKLQRYYMLHAYAWQAGYLGAEDEFEGVAPPVEDDDEALPAIFRRGVPAPGATSERKVTSGREVLDRSRPSPAALQQPAGETSLGPPTIPQSLEGEPEVPIETQGERVPAETATGREGARLLLKQGPGPEAAVSEPELPIRGEGEREVALRTATGEINFHTMAESVSKVETVGSGMLTAAVEQVESGGDPSAVSPRGAIGSMQTMPDTLTNPGYGVAPARPGPSGKISAEEMRRVGRDYLMAMLRTFDGDLDHALVAYNWGPGNAKRWVAQGADLSALPEETRRYVRKVRKELRRRGGLAQPKPRRRPSRAESL